MGLIEVNLATLATMDCGRLSGAFDKLIKQVVDDLHNRPAEDGERKVSMHVHIKPITDQQGELVNAKTYVSFTAQTPKMRTQDYVMEPRRSGHLGFNDLSPDDPQQMTIDEAATPPNPTEEEGGEES